MQILILSNGQTNVAMERQKTKAKPLVTHLVPSLDYHLPKSIRTFEMTGTRREKSVILPSID
jgi:hypothetical protein